MSGSLRILVLTPEYRSHGGGISTYYRVLLPALVRAGCQVRVIEGSAFASTTEADPQILDGVSVETLEARRLRSRESRIPALTAMPTLARSIAASWAMWEQSDSASGMDIIEATDFGMPFIAPLLNSTVPVVMQMHGSQGQIGRHDPITCETLDNSVALALETWAGSQAAAVQSPSIANSRYWAGQMQRDVVCSRPAWSQCLKGQPGAFSGGISVFGRVQRWKGPQILCEAVALLGEGCPPIDWYGRDTSFESVNQTCSGWLRVQYPDIWGKKVNWHPTVPPPRVAQIQAESLINVVPSTWDVFNLAVVEAMASGRPVVCSAAAGASELIRDGVTGFVYKNNSPEDLAAVMLRALSLPGEQLSEIGTAARQTVMQELDPDRVAADRVAAYRRVLKNDRPAVNPAPEWVQRLCMPDPEATVNEYAFLDRQPLRSVAKYVIRRSARKISAQ